MLLVDDRNRADALTTDAVEAKVGSERSQPTPTPAAAPVTDGPPAEPALLPDLAARIAMLDVELAKLPLGRIRDLSVLVRGILAGDKPRPVVTHSTSRGVLCAMADVSDHHMRTDVAVGALLDRLLPLLEDIPGRQVRVAADGTLEVTVPTYEAVREAMEEHVAAGKTVRRQQNSSRRISNLAVSEITGRNRQQVQACTRTMNYLAELAKRPGVLGKPFRRRDMCAASGRFYVKVIEWLDERHAAKLPLPEKRRGRSGCPDHDFIRRAISPLCPDFRGRKDYQERIARHLADFGVAPESARSSGPVNWGEACDKLQEIWCEKKGKAGLANLDTAMGRIAQARGLEGHAAVPDNLFVDVDTLIVDAAAAGTPLGDSSRRNLGVFVRFAQKRLDEALRRADDLPSDPAKALHLAILSSGKTLAELEELSRDPITGERLCKAMLVKLRTTSAVIPEKYEPCLTRLEQEVFHTGGRIADRFLRREKLQDLVCTAYYRKLPWKIRQLLPEGAWKLTDEELEPLVVERRDKVLKQDRMNSKVLAASRRVMGQLPALPDGAPVLTEIEDFIAYKMCVIPELMRHYRGRWQPASADIGRRQLINLARFCAMDRTKGGLGMAWEDVSLASMLNWKLVASWLNWLCGRYADVEHDGKKRGPWLTPFDLSIVTICISMLDPVNGYITQMKERFCPRLTVEERQLPSYGHLEGLRVRMQADTKSEEKPLDREEEFEDLFSRVQVDRPLMPPELVAAAATDWVATCAMTRNRLSNLGYYLARFIDKGRDPMVAIDVIVRSKDPMSFLREILEAAQAEIPDRRLKPYEHAVAMRDILLFALLSLTGLRSKNLRHILYDPGGGGHISLVSPEDANGADGADALLINIPWQNFKNLGSSHLFGRDGNKMDYQRRLEDWYNVVPLFQHYVDKCLPYLVRTFAERLRNAAEPADLEAGLVKQSTRALFPTPSLMLMGVDDLNRICHDLTARYHVIDPKTGLVRPGRMMFGPHAVRDVLATHVIKASDDEGRWEIAADLLQTSVEMVKERYTKRTIVERTGRADPHFSATSRGMPSLQLA